MRTVPRPVLMDITDTHRMPALLTGTMARSGLAAECLSERARGSGAAMATMAGVMHTAIAATIIIVVMAAVMRMAEGIGIVAAITIAADTTAISVAMATAVFMAEVTAIGSLRV